MMKRFATLSLLTFLFVAASNGLAGGCLAQDAKIPVPITGSGGWFELVGELGVKLGEMATVEGIVVEGAFKGYEGGPNLVVQVINGKATQRLIQIPISPYFGEFGDADFGRKGPPNVKNGATYRLRVYESGGFVGTPSDAYQEAGIMLQTTGFYFRNYLSVVSGDKIEPIVWSPTQFLDREALLSGVATNENEVATIHAPGWKVILTGVEKWSDAETGKQAEVFGTIRATEPKETFRAENCRARLTKLEDQLGRNVALRGKARSLNGHWWFHYRGTDLYVEGMEQLPNWATENHWRPMEITGVLEQAQLPRIDQITEKPDRDLATYYVVKRPKWIPVDELLTPELSLEE
ncbi:MAG: hypothetical protein C0483_21380 [Pirellula sp.]|nr:hypothetical protein [Pirellula sp.]